MPVGLVVGHLLVRDGVAAVAAAAHAAAHVPAALGRTAVVLDPVRLPPLGLFEVGVGALALAQILAVRTLRTGWSPRCPAARLVLRPIRLTLAAMGTALPVAVLAVLPLAVYGPPRPGLLAVLAVLAAGSLLCGAPAAV